MTTLRACRARYTNGPWGEPSSFFERSGSAVVALLRRRARLAEKRTDEISFLRSEAQNEQKGGVPTSVEKKPRGVNITQLSFHVTSRNAPLSSPSSPPCAPSIRC